MRDIRLIAQRLPMPKGWKLSLNRSFLSSAFDKAEKKAKTSAARAQLDSERWFEMGMQEEEENKYYTTKLVRQATRLWVPRPRAFDDQGYLTEHWERMDRTGGIALSLSGAKMLRDEIRQELRARHEIRAQYFFWVTSAMGIVGAITGLAAVLTKK